MNEAPLVKMESRDRETDKNKNMENKIMSLIRNMLWK